MLHFFHFFVAFVSLNMINLSRSQMFAQQIEKTRRKTLVFMTHSSTPRAPQKVLALTSALALLAGIASNSWAATSVGGSFIGRGADPGDILAPSEVAGVVPQANWNNIDSGTTFKGTTAPMLDSAGNFTAVRIIYDCSDSWNSDGGSTTPDEKLMKGIIKANPEPDLAPANNSDRVQFTITNLSPSTAYNVIVYTVENGTQAKMALTVGATTYYIGEEAVFSGTYELATSTSGSYDPANYAEFDGVTSDANGRIVVTGVKFIDNPQVNDGIGVAGIQVVRTSGSFPPNTQAASITSSPSSTNVIIGFPVTFTVGTSGPHYTQWRTNGVNIAGATSDSYTIAATTAADNGVVYVAVVYNNVNTNTSSPATLSTHPNDVPVSITSNPQDTLAVEGGTASFSVTATGNFIRYQWQKNNVNVLNATNANYTTPPTVYPGDNGATFRVIVYNNVNTNTSTSAVLTVDQNSPPSLTQGFLKVERWENIGNNGGVTGISDLKTNIAGNGVTGTTPTTTFYVGGANVPQTNPDLSNFGDRAWGWVKADVAGDYDFFIRSDDASELYFNSTDPGLGQTNTIPDVQDPFTYLIAEEYTCCNPFQEPPSPRATAAPIHLEAGRYYGFVMLLKEIGGGDYVQVAWRPTTDTTPAANLTTIPAPNVYTLASPAGQRASISRQPVNTSVIQGRRVTFSTAVTTTPLAGAYSLQWYKNGTAIPGATSDTYTIPPAAYPGDNGSVFSVRALTLRGVLTSANATLTVIQDTFPPVASVGTITSQGGVVEVGFSFDEPLNVATLVSGNFSVLGQSTTFKLVTNSYNDYQGAVLDATTLVPGTTYTARVKSVADVYGNAMPQTDIPFRVGPVQWADTGTPARPGQVVPAGDTGFDVLNGGRQEWGTYDEITMAYVKKTNDFDVQVQVVYAEPGSEWTRVGLQARNTLNVGEDPNDRNSSTSPASAYAQTHVNPNQTLGSSGRYDPSGGTPSNPTPNNGHEQNQRLAAGSTSSGWGSPGTPPVYPNVWLRLKRTGTDLHGFRSTDGLNWIDQGQTTLVDQQPDMYVGTFLGVETGNIWANPPHDVWGGPFDPIYDRLFVAQFRNFTDVPALSISVVAGHPVVTFTGMLQSASAVTGPYTDLPSATSPYTVPTGPGATFFRVRGSITPK